MIIQIKSMSKEPVADEFKKFSRVLERTVREAAAQMAGFFKTDQKAEEA